MLKSLFRLADIARSRLKMCPALLLVVSMLQSVGQKLQKKKLPSGLYKSCVLLRLAPKLSLRGLMTIMILKSLVTLQ